MSKIETEVKRIYYKNNVKKAHRSSLACALICYFPAILSLLLFLFLIQPSNIGAANKLWCVQADPLAKIFSEQQNLVEVVDTPDVARGAHADFQFVLHAGEDSLSEVSLSILPFSSSSVVGIELDSIRTGFVGYVGVGKLAPETFPGVVMPKSHLFPDPILELSKTGVSKNRSQPIWVSVYVPYGTPKGLYTTVLTVSGKQRGRVFTFRKKLVLRVYNVDMPKQELEVANWFSMDSFKKSYDNGWKYAAHNSQEWFNLLKETARKLRESHNTSVVISPLQWTNISKIGSTYHFDFTLFDRLVNLFREAGVMTTLEGGFIAQREGGWESNFVVQVPEANTAANEYKYSLKPITDREASAFYKQFMPAFYRHVIGTFPGLTYYQHIADEVIDANADSYMQIAKYIKKVCPQIRLIETTATPRVGSTVDVLVPELDHYHDDYESYRKLQNSGHQIWFYTCYLPQGRYANRFIEQPLLLTRLLHWINFKYGATGYLHWGFNRWVGNPYKETIQDQGGGVILVGGDSWIVYPSKTNRIYGSIRLDAMRDGIEDYALLQALSKKNKTIAYNLCNSIVKDWTSYQLDTRQFKQAHKELLVALEDINVTK